MLTAMGGLIIVVMLIITVPLCIAIASYEPKQYKKLVDLENQRRQIARQIVEETSNANWLTRWRFRRYLKKGGDLL